MWESTLHSLTFSSSPIKALTHFATLFGCCISRQRLRQPPFLGPFLDMIFRPRLTHKARPWVQMMPEEVLTDYRSKGIIQGHTIPMHLAKLFSKHFAVRFFRLLGRRPAPSTARTPRIMQDEAVDIVQPTVQVTTATESVRMCSRAQQLEDPMGRTRQLKIQFFSAQAGSLSH